MRLFLSSENVGNYADRLLDLVGQNKHLVYIPNAGDDRAEADSTAKKKAHKKQFEDLGFKFMEVDLKDYFGKSEELAKKFDGAGLVWVPGGNTFLIRRAMYDSGMDSLLLGLLDEDKIVYGGSSAGSIVMTPSLRGTERGDSPERVRNTYGKDVIWEGLNLIDYHIVPHYASDWFGKEADSMIAYFKEHDLPYKTLIDGQVIIVDGSRVELLK